MTISYITFSIMSRHSSILHTLNFIRSTNKARQKREDHESNRLDRAMQCRKRIKIQKRQSNGHTGGVQSSFATHVLTF